MHIIKSLIYLSKGNLPSKMAHTTQIAKMSQAFSKQVDNFELVTCGDILSAIKGMDLEFQKWYGIRYKFKLLRLPLHFKLKYPFKQSYENYWFYKLAVLYAYIKSPTVVYTRTPAIANLLLGLGMPVIWEWHEHLQDEYYSFLHCKHLLGVVTISETLADEYIRSGLPPEKLLVTPNAVDIDIFLPYQEQKVARKKLFFSENEKIVLYSGHLYEYKGISTILDTARLLPEYKFVLVGGWIDDIKRVTATCQENNLHNVHIVGHVQQSELATYLYAADVLILPTSKHWYLAEVTSPLKLFEYMFSRRPIVASALPTIMAVVKDRQNALLAESDNPFSFKEAIVSLFENPKLANSIAECAFQEVQNLTWDNRVQRILHFIEQRIQKTDRSAMFNKTNLISYTQKKLSLRLDDYLLAFQKWQMSRSK